MIKTILFATQIPQSNHPALGPIFKVTFTDNTTFQMYSETFFDQIPKWEPNQPLEGKFINIHEAFLVD
jgi:hypothetical protein